MWLLGSLVHLWGATLWLRRGRMAALPPAGSASTSWQVLHCEFRHSKDMDFFFNTRHTHFMTSKCSTSLNTSLKKEDCWSVAKYAPSERRRHSAFFYFTFHSGLLQLPDLKIGLINPEYKNISQVFRWQDFFPSTWNPPGSKKNLGQMEKWLREFNWHWASRDWRKTLFWAHAAEVTGNSKNSL